jgi:cytochrome P450
VTGPAEPRGPVVDYDHHRPTSEWDPHAAHAELRQRCPVAFTEHHGGYWVVTDHGVLTGCARDPATFSSEHDLDGSGLGTEFQGIGLPAEPSHRSIPSEVDPPALLEYRRLLQPWVTPTATAEWRRRAERWAADCIEPHLDEGRIDLVLDVANPVPAMFTLALVGLPVEEWERFAAPLHDLVHAAPGSPEKLRARAQVAELREALRRLVGGRRRHPAEDLASAVAHAEIGGERVTEEQAVSTLFAVVSGGVDTTTALLANALYWLDEHRDVRTQLIEHPSRRPAAREELLRFFSPAPATARTVVHDVVIGGVSLRRGDRVLLSWAAANRDDAVFADPDEMDLTRDTKHHVAFGFGPHRCIGAPVARTTFDAVVDVVLDTIPDYAVDRARAERYRRVGAVNGWVSIPATFSPVQRGAAAAPVEVRR